MATVREVIERGRSAKLKGDRRIAIIGAGIGGIAMAYALEQAGISDFTIYEKASSVGGTWRENVYPGVACDIPSYAYSFTFALNPEWSQSFAPGEEIRQYLENTCRQLDLNWRIRFGKEVVSARYRDDGWHLEMADGDSTVVDAVIACTGFLHVANEVRLPGIERFEGEVLHSAKWRHDADLRGKRVALVGSGSTAAQIIPAIVDQVGGLTIFQRTAQWVYPITRERHSDEQKRLLRGDAGQLYAIYDRIIAESQRDLGALSAGDPEITRRYFEECSNNLAQVEDAGLRAKLTPDYTMMCKRLVMTEGFYEAVQRPHCNVVTSPIERIEPQAVRTADGAEHAADAIILATGFKTKEYFRSINPVGIDGITLDDAWAGGVSSFATVSFAGFPNLFAIGGPISALGNQSYVTGAELQTGYIIRLLKMLEDSGARALAPRPEAEQRFKADNAAAAQGTVWLSGCRSWFLDENNNFQFWTRSPDAYVEMMDEGPRQADFQLFF